MNKMSLLKLTNQNSKKNEQEVSPDIRLCYFTVFTNKGIGYVCMAIQRPEKGDNSNFYKAGFQTYSPEEVKPFSKTHARNAAVGRVIRFKAERKDTQKNICPTNPRISFEYKAEVGEKFNLKDVFERGLQLAMKSLSVPGWCARGKIVYGLDPKAEKMKFVNKKLPKSQVAKNQ